MTREISLLELPCSEEEFFAMPVLLRMKLLWVVSEIKYYQAIVVSGQRYRGGLLPLFGVTLLECGILLFAVGVVFA